MIQTLFDQFKTIFGTYSPIVITYTDGTEEAFIDFSYVFSCIFAIVLLYGVLRICGALLSRGNR